MRLVDDVDLVFTEDALTAIAHAALERKTGARALRTIIEEIMLDIMFDIPTRRDVARCVVGAESVLERKAPRLELRDDIEPQQKTA
jgi:ATP-dependent Clp protease ATP-binding subunit ClpX